jgi:hypothetical protein
LADARHLPHGRSPGGDRHLNFYGNRDNLREHRETRAVPLVRLAREREHLHVLPGEPHTLALG